jgi:hypothetical protein
MMQTVVRRTDPPPAKPIFREVFRVNLNVQMVNGSGNCHQNQHKENDSQMHRDEQDDEGYYQRLQDGFYRVEGEACPRGSDNAIVVHVMEKSKDFRVVHPTVEEVIIGFMNQHGNHKAYRQVPPAVFRRIGVNGSFPVKVKPDHSNERECENEGSYG